MCVYVHMQLPRQMFGTTEGRLTGKITGTFTGTIALDGIARKAHETTDFTSNGLAGKIESNTHCITPYSVRTNEAVFRFVPVCDNPYSMWPE
jgi:hypothetical protein